ncbi:MAG: ABC transporter substrate-binding protein [Actinomycetota bacterium]|nr:ABC transporter substrate-binding protein [Actinomycetota bacterium]
MGYNRQVRTVGLLLLAGMATAACSGGGGSSTGSFNPALATDRLTPGGTPNPDGVLRYGVDFPNEFTPNTFDPAQSLNSCDKVDEGLIYDTLTRLSPTGQLEPGLAQSWDFTPGGYSLTLHLRPGVKFSDGNPVDAAAVKAAVLHTKTSPLRTSLEVIKSITVDDPLTLTFNLSAPTPADLLYAFNDLDGMIADPAHTSSLAKDPVGSGPYVLVSSSPSEIVLKKNPNYWDASAYQPAGIDFIQVATGPPSVAALEAGTIDMTQFQPESLTTVRADSKLGYAIQPSHEYLTIQFRLDTPPVNNLLVRQAINDAVNRTEINDVVLAGTGRVTDETFAPDQPVAYNPSVADEYSYNPARAKQLLAQAGYPNGVTISMVIPAGVTLTAREAVLLKNEMAPAGIDLKIVAVDPGSLLTDFYEHKQNDAIALPYPAEEEYARELYDQYGAKGFTAILTGSVQGGQYEQLLIEGQGTLDPKALTPIMQQATALTTNRALQVPIAFMAQMTAWNGSRIGGTPSAGSDPCRAVFTGLYVKK